MFSVVTGMKDGQKVFFHDEQGFIPTVRHGTLHGSIAADLLAKQLQEPRFSNCSIGVTDIKVELYDGVVNA